MLFISLWSSTTYNKSPLLSIKPTLFLSIKEFSIFLTSLWFAIQKYFVIINFVYEYRQEADGHKSSQVLKNQRLMEEAKVNKNIFHQYKPPH